MKAPKPEVSDLEIRSEVVIDAAIEVVWETLTQPDQITRWLADRAELKLEPGEQGRLAFRDEEGRTAHIVPLVVEAVEAPHLFSFRWCHPEGEHPVAGNSTLVEFRLSPERGGGTRVTVTEIDLERVSWPEPDKQRFAEDHQAGWSRHLGRLANVLASGHQPGATGS
jgi:uncharacterized protein YndB with AHSA1/START domain